jgi:hypothetical protein
MDIGKPQRIVRVEPLRDPVPRKVPAPPPPAPRPGKTPAAS